MGTHSARRPRTTTTLAGRGLFTATAAFALVGGSAGMAFAGEAPSHGEGSHGHEAAQEHGQQDCSIPVVDPGTETLGGTVNALSGGATAPVLDAGNRALAPVHDAVCPPANDVLGQLPVPGATGDAASDAASEATSGATSGATSDEDSGSATDEASDDATGDATDGATDEGTDEATDEGTDATPGAATPAASSAPGTTTVTDLPDQAPSMS